MHGQTRGGARHYYRCAARARYPGIADSHSRDVLVPEQPVLKALDQWLDELFAPEHATTTAHEIVAAATQGLDRDGQIDAARRRITSARQELARCRAALRDAESEPARREILAWLDEAAAEKERADAALNAAMELSPPAFSIDEVLAVVERYGGLTGVLREATDAERATLYNTLGVSAVYNAESNEVRLGADPVALAVCRRGVHTRTHTGPAPR